MPEQEKDTLRISQTDKRLLIQFPVKTIIPSVPFLIDLATIYIVHIVVILVAFLSSGSWAVIVGGSTALSLLILIFVLTPLSFWWNFFASDQLELTRSHLILSRQKWPFAKQGGRYPRSEIEQIETITTNNRAWHLKIPGLRLLFYMEHGDIAFELKGNFRARIGRNLSDEEMEQIAELLRQEMNN